MKYPEVWNYVAGSFVRGEHVYRDVFNPSDGSVISRVPLSSRDDVDREVQVAQAAFPAWSTLRMKERVRVFYNCRSLLERDNDELVDL